MHALIRHSTDQLRDGLRCLAEDNALTPTFRSVEEVLALAGFVRNGTMVTPAGQRFLRSGT